VLVFSQEVYSKNKYDIISYGAMQMWLAEFSF
jgi:hypothetical protein